MEWSHDNVIEFIELVEKETCIWNPKNRENKNKAMVNEAWVRLAKNFSLPSTVDELKRKRNTLLTQYRDCLKKITESTEAAGSDAEEVYKPSWFAFEAMHSYMGPVYGYQPTSVEAEDSTEEYLLFHDPASNEADFERDIKRSEPEYYPPKRKRYSLNVKPFKKHTDDPLTVHKTNSRREYEKPVNECDLFAQLLAQKMKPLDVDDRLILMNEIDNLVFKHIMNVRKRLKKRLASESNISVS